MEVFYAEVSLTESAKKTQFVNNTIIAGQHQILEHPCADYHQAVSLVLEVLTMGRNALLKGKETIHAVGHRVVHGGEAYPKARLLIEVLVKTVEKLSRLAPLHNPAQT